MRWTSAIGAVALLVSVASACSSGSSSKSSAPTSPAAAVAPGSATLTGFPRNATLYTSGTAYTPPSNWNPFNLGNFATGTQGLVYEPLYLYDPVKGTYHPWLATGGT